MPPPSPAHWPAHVRRKKTGRSSSDYNPAHHVGLPPDEVQRMFARPQVVNIEAERIFSKPLSDELAAKAVRRWRWRTARISAVWRRQLHQTGQ